MTSSDGQYASSGQSRLYEAADLMLEHSGLPLIGASGTSDGGYGLPENRLPQMQPQTNSAPLVPRTSYMDYRVPFQGVSQDRGHRYDTSIDGILHSPQDKQQHPGPRGHGHFPELAEAHISSSSSTAQRPSDSNFPGSAYVDYKSSMDGSEPVSPTSSKGRAAHGSDTGFSRKNRNSVSNPREHEDSKPPPWSELKTKAGKERKRLPLACIACRRKKIRCSGEKPACKHCLRSRIPCVYRVTARKAAPRTDYMAMLDKRLKRMEERVIKIIPKEGKEDVDAIPRAILKPSGPGSNIKGGSGRKRAAVEAFSHDSEDSTEVKMNTRPLPNSERKSSNRLDEGIDKLPPKDIQEHLSEVFFDCLYGQSYHLLHKPSYMRRLRAGTVPPVLVLAVCAISARFSTHPQVDSEPAFLRGEEWAAPAREIALKRYDEPTITILTVLLILGLHEFGTCQGGRSWMFGGMALRMAYALQLQEELDHDPLGQNNEKKTELSPTDREIRRRTMWACFLMDRFNSSGTERPMFANEDSIRIQLPIKEEYFQMGMSGPTESLDGSVPNQVVDETGQMSNPKDNMGVCAYLVRIIALFGRVVKYLNLGGKQRDSRKCWDPQSGFAALKKEAENFRTTLPSDLQNNTANLQSHAAGKLGNQFIFLHIAISQVLLFLHRWSIPTAPGEAGIPKDAPKDFVTQAGHIAIEESNRISTLLEVATDHSVFAPFAGYCAFVSGAVHVWGLFSKNPSLEESSKANLEQNVRYLHKMKTYWGMFRFMVLNLKSIYQRHMDVSRGSEVEEGAQGAAIFQYGDWFQKYPHGVSPTDYKDPATKIKKESMHEDSLGQDLGLQSVEDFVHTVSPPAGNPSHRKAIKKASKNISHMDPPQPTQPLQVDQERDISQHHQHRLPAPIMAPSGPIDQSPVSPSTLTSQQTLYTPSHPNFPPSYDMVSMSPIPNSGVFSQQLDRHLLYGSYTGADPTSGSTLDGLPNSLDPVMQDPLFANNIWGPADGMDFPQQVIGAQDSYNDPGSSAWFLPYKLNGSDMGAKMNYEDYVGDGMGRMGRMGQ